MKELVLKKRTELEEICRKTHLVPEADCDTEHFLAAIESGITFSALMVISLCIALASPYSSNLVIGCTIDHNFINV